jgi:hypothetical protein
MMSSPVSPRVRLMAMVTTSAANTGTVPAAKIMRASSVSPPQYATTPPTRARAGTATRAIVVRRLTVIGLLIACAAGLPPQYAYGSAGKALMHRKERAGAYPIPVLGISLCTAQKRAKSLCADAVQALSATADRRGKVR